MSATATLAFQREPEMRKPPGSATASHSQVSEALMQEDIAKLAYALWEQRGCPHGSSEVDWLEAEQQLLGSSEPISR